MRSVPTSLARVGPRHESIAHRMTPRRAEEDVTAVNGRIGSPHLGPGRATEGRSGNGRSGKPSHGAMSLNLLLSP